MAAGGVRPTDEAKVTVQQMPTMIRAADRTDGAATAAGSSRAGLVAGIGGFALGVGYAVFVRFYHAAGGLGFGVAEPVAAEVQWASYRAGLLILVGAVACVVLTLRELRTVPPALPRIGGREVPRVIMLVLCAAPTVAGGVFAIGHGGGGIIGPLLELAGTGTASVFADSPPHSTRELLWHIGFYGPWFFLMGLCLVLSMLGYLRQSGVKSRTVAITRAIVTLAGVAGVLFFTLALMLHWEWTAT